jgi:hypothetical protein
MSSFAVNFEMLTICYSDSRSLAKFSAEQIFPSLSFDLLKKVQKSLQIIVRSCPTIRPEWCLTSLAFVGWARALEFDVIIAPNTSRAS